MIKDPNKKRLSGELSGEQILSMLTNPALQSVLPLMLLGEQREDIKGSYERADEMRRKAADVEPGKVGPAVTGTEAGIGAGVLALGGLLGEKTGRLATGLAQGFLSAREGRRAEKVETEREKAAREQLRFRTEAEIEESKARRKQTELDRLAEAGRQREGRQRWEAGQANYLYDRARMAAGDGDIETVRSAIDQMALIDPARASSMHGMLADAEVNRKAKASAQGSAELRAAQSALKTATPGELPVIEAQIRAAGRKAYPELEDFDLGAFMSQGMRDRILKESDAILRRAQASMALRGTLSPDERIALAENLSEGITRAFIGVDFTNEQYGPRWQGYRDQAVELAKREIMAMVDGQTVAYLKYLDDVKDRNRRFEELKRHHLELESQGETRLAQGWAQIGVAQARLDNEMTRFYAGQEFKITEAMIKDALTQAGVAGRKASDFEAAAAASKDEATAERLRKAARLLRETEASLKKQATDAQDAVRFDNEVRFARRAIAEGAKQAADAEEAARIEKAVKARFRERMGKDLPG